MARFAKNFGVLRSKSAPSGRLTIRCRRVVVQFEIHRAGAVGPSVESLSHANQEEIHADEAQEEAAKKRASREDFSQAAARIDGDCNLKLRTDSGREVECNAKQRPHLDYGYAVTSHSSQGQTAERVLIHVDTEQAPGELVNSRMAYVSVSRAQFDVQMYTNDAKALGYELSRDVSHPTAIQQEPAAAQKIEPQAVSMEIAQGSSMGLRMVFCPLAV
jgi:hypothetical protein